MPHIETAVSAPPESFALARVVRIIATLVEAASGHADFGGLTMEPHRRSAPLLVALYINAGLLLAVLVAILARGSVVPAALAAVPSPQPIAGGANLYLMPAQFNVSTWGCYVLDIDAQTLCAYRYKPKTGDGADLELIAARKISYDRKLTNFNSDHPSWMEVKQWVEQAAEGIRGTGNLASDRKPQQDKDAADGAH